MIIKSTHRRPATERREHDNTLLINYDGSTSNQHTKHGPNVIIVSLFIL